MNQTRLPRRIVDVKTRALGDETLIMRELDSQALVLTAPEALLLELCDGRMTLSEAAEILTARFGPQIVGEIPSLLSRLRDGELLAPEVMPRCDSQGYVVSELGNETLIFRPQVGGVVRLDSTAATVWRLCDGATRTSDATRQIAALQAIPFEAAEELLWNALAQLKKHGFFNAGLPRPCSRREFLTTWGKVAVMLPVVAAALAPPPAQAMSVTCLSDAACRVWSPNGTRISTCIRCGSGTAQCNLNNRACMTCYSKAAVGTCLSDGFSTALCGGGNNVCCLQVTGGVQGRDCTATRAIAGNGSTYCCCTCS